MKLISNCPRTGLTRKVTSWDVHLMHSTRQVILECTVSLFDAQDQVIENASTRSYVVPFVASENKYVNPATGADLTDDQAQQYHQYLAAKDFFEREQVGAAPDNPLPFEPVSSWSVYKARLAQPEIVNDVVDGVIESMDQKKNFDV